MSVMSKIKSNIYMGKDEPRGWDLFSVRPIYRFMTSPFYPAVFLVPSAAIFGLVVYFGIFGTERPAYNFATTLTWNIWWPLLPISLILLGRVWCAICPIVPVISAVQWLTKPKALPGKFLKRYGIWLMGLGFVLLTLADRLWQITGSPVGTAFFLLLLAVVAAVAAAFYVGRAFCRFICPIGALTGLYSMVAMVGLRSKGKVECQGCGKECFKGSSSHAGCPLYQYVNTMDSNRNCNLCAECLKSCPKGSIKLSIRMPGKDLWQLRSPILGEALLVIFLVGMVFFQTVDMSKGWGDYMRWLLQFVPFGSYKLGIAISFAGVLAVIAFAYLAVSKWSAGTQKWSHNFAFFGYAYIPLALAVHVAHNSGHLMSEGPNALRIAAKTLANPLSVAAAQSPIAESASMSLVYLLPLVVLGGVGSAYAAWRISRRSDLQDSRSKLLPHLVLVAVLTAVFAVAFLLPMAPRHAH